MPSGHSNLRKASPACPSVRTKALHPCRYSPAGCLNTSVAYQMLNRLPFKVGFHWDHRNLPQKKGECELPCFTLV